jgi:hypothetical protein
MRPSPSLFSFNPIITFLTARLISDWFTLALSYPIPAYFLLSSQPGLCPGMTRILVGRCSASPIKGLPIIISQGARLADDWFLSKPIVVTSHPSLLPASFIGF